MALSCSYALWLGISQRSYFLSLSWDGPLRSFAEKRRPSLAWPCLETPTSFVAKMESLFLECYKKEPPSLGA